MKNLKHYVIYIIFGALTTLVSFVSLWLLRTFVPQLDANIANTISIILGIIFAYFTNKRYVFKSSEKNKLKEFGKFFLSRGFSMVVEIVLFWILTKIMPQETLYEMIAKAICSIVVIILNYILSRFFVFQDKEK